MKMLKMKSTLKSTITQLYKVQCLVDDIQIQIQIDKVQCPENDI